MACRRNLVIGLLGRAGPVTSPPSCAPCPRPTPTPRHPRDRVRRPGDRPVPADRTPAWRQHVRPAEDALRELFGHDQEVSAGTGRTRYRFCRLPRPAAPGEVGPVRRAGSCWGSGCSGQPAWRCGRARPPAPPADVQVERPVHQPNTYSRLRPRRLLSARAAVPGTGFIERTAVAAFSGQVWLAVRSICRARPPARHTSTRIRR